MSSSRFVPTVYLIVAVAAASAVGLSSCGGGGASRTGIVAPSSGSRAAQTVITPPGNRAPQSVGTIPVQALTTGENAAIVDVTPYFRDPENDRLTYLAASSRPEVILARMLGSTMTLNPVSSGVATITVTASDGNTDATQTVVATVAEPGGGQTATQEEITHAETQGSNTGQTKTAEPENALTGIGVLAQDSQGRETYMRVRIEPAGAQWARVNFEIEPYEAGNMCCYQSFADDVYIKFTCAGGYSGGATVKIIVDDHYGHRFEKPISFTCR